MIDLHGVELVVVMTRVVGVTGGILVEGDTELDCWGRIFTSGESGMLLFSR